MVKRSLSSTVLLASLFLLLAACSGRQTPAEAPGSQSGTAGETSGADAAPGAWREITLTDARTGATFKLSDYAGRVVILEMMDPLCYLCRDQIEEIAAALQVVGDRAAAVSVDVGGKPTALVTWADQAGATWPVAKMPVEFGQALMAEFGARVVSPSNTPVIMIDPSGAAHVTDNGIKKSAALVELVDQWAP
jgi:hypothetical protein